MPDELVHLTVPGDASDPRVPPDDPPGVVVHRVPALHPDDVTVVHGLRMTTPSRTLVDLAEILSLEQLRAAFRSARELGLLDLDALAASRARSEWRPSLAMLDRVIDEFTP